MKYILLKTTYPNINIISVSVYNVVGRKTNNLLRYLFKNMALLVQKLSKSVFGNFDTKNKVDPMATKPRFGGGVKGLGGQTT